MKLAGLSNKVHKLCFTKSIPLLSNTMITRNFGYFTNLNVKSSGIMYKTRLLCKSPLNQFSTKSKITPKILCDVIGVKYYPYNEEIELDYKADVRVLDENETHLGIMSLAEAREKAQDRDVDLVLRNARLSPPIVKVMSYK